MSQNPSDHDADQDNQEEAPKRATMPIGDVMVYLQRGQMIENVKIPRLKLKGVFEKPVRFKNCLLAHVDFDGAVFEDKVEMIRCTIDRPRCSHRTHFKSDWDCSESTFNNAVIREMTIDGHFKCRAIRAKTKLQFLDCEFKGKYFFWEAHIDGWFEHKKCVFYDECDIRSMHVEQGLIFRECRFEKNLTARGMVVHKKVEFVDSTAERMVDFSKAKLHDFVYLETLKGGQLQQFAFLNALAERLLIRPEQLQHRLASENEGRYDDAMQEYGLLKRCYENLHRYDFQDWAFYRFKVNQRRGAGHSWSRPWTKLTQFFNWSMLDLGCGYGTNPFRAVVASIIIITFFGAIYMADINSLEVANLPFEGTKEDWPNRTMIGLLTSVSVFTSGMAGIRDLAKGWMNIPLVIESLLGTLLFGLFIVAFSRKVIR